VKFKKKLGLQAGINFIENYIFHKVKLYYEVDLMSKSFRFLIYVLLVASIYCSVACAEKDIWFQRDNNQSDTELLFIALDMTAELKDANLTQSQLDNIDASNIDYIRPVYILEYNVTGKSTTLPEGNASNKEILSLLPKNIKNGRLAWLIVHSLESAEPGSNETAMAQAESKIGQSGIHNTPNECFTDRWGRIICV
jgi:hypothetical protein